MFYTIVINARIASVLFDSAGMGLCNAKYFLTQYLAISFFLIASLFSSVSRGGNHKTSGRQTGQAGVQTDLVKLPLVEKPRMYRLLLMLNDT